MKITNCLGFVEGDFSARHSRFVKGNLKKHELKIGTSFNEIPSIPIRSDLCSFEP